MKQEDGFDTAFSVWLWWLRFFNSSVRRAGETRLAGPEVK
jgi:hypothetical protein